MKFSSNPQAISWFRDKYKAGDLKLRPPYQRKPVWAARQKCYLIESILLGLPVPEIFIHQTTDEDGNTKHAVVDGQQRIRTVLQFVGFETRPHVGPDDETHGRRRDGRVTHRLQAPSRYARIK